VAVLPVALAEYGVIYMDLPEAALGTLALAAWITGRPRACAVALAMAVLCKLTAALVAVVVVVDALARRRPARDWLTVLIPVAATVLSGSAITAGPRGGGSWRRAASRWRRPTSTRS
jgi:predicted membrane-bound dolichyl-phosphate-mannose-protein mannosyltransferase